MYAIRSYYAVSTYAVAARKVGVVDADIDAYVPQAFFSTLTNVNFDAERIIDFSRRADAYRNDLRVRYEDACAAQGVTPEQMPAAAHYRLPDAKTVMLSDALSFALNRGKKEVGDDVIGLRLLCLYGLKGAAAYMEHARVLGQTDAQVAGRFHEIMAYLGSQPADAGALFQCSMDIGKLNYRVMEMLDKGETETVITSYSIHYTKLYERLGTRRIPFAGSARRCRNFRRGACTS